MAAGQLGFIAGDNNVKTCRESHPAVNLQLPGCGEFATVVAGEFA